MTLSVLVLDTHAAASDYPAVACLWRGSKSTRAACGHEGVELCCGKLFFFCRSDCIYLSSIDTGLKQQVSNIEQGNALLEEIFPCAFQWNSPPAIANATSL